MSWAVFKNKHKVGKVYDTRIQAITEAKEKGHVVVIKGKIYLAEGVDIKEVIDTSKTIKEYRFTVRERLKRNRIYKIKAVSEEAALDLLDGFKQVPEEEDAAQEKIEVDDYEIIDMNRIDPKVGETVTYLNGDRGTIIKVGSKGYYGITVDIQDEEIAESSHRFSWCEIEQVWEEMKLKQ